MKTTRPATQRLAMTIIEMSLTMALLISLAGVMAFSFGGYREWKLGKKAGATLQSVYIAQKSMLADRPTMTLAEATASDLLPYLPGHATEMPRVESNEGTQMAVDYQVMPPVVVGGYDPSGCPEDGIWDVGKP